MFCRHARRAIPRTLFGRILEDWRGCSDPDRMPTSAIREIRLPANCKRSRWGVPPASLRLKDC